ncbi:MAG TPA: FtsX-like permease family protein [Bacteroidales bacterium]|jgi:ABC-type lipoprotein release transport system permease subunit|nr:FtsX-like permease family protein [Bacteroidales bacterium]HQH23128.1 FtsX-like permease family protein [Bacteroidales bacterium]HQJ81014.1 FtsX-like permease family protein [Bacteroidales bacterium]
MIWSIAWKNVWRNRKRSLVVIVAVSLGITGGVFLFGFVEGWSRQRMDNAIYNEVSHIQIHNSEYRKNEEIGLTVQNLNGLSRSIDTLRELSAWTKRTKIIAMLETPWGNTGLKLYGINPEKEKRISRIHNMIVRDGGRYIDKKNPSDILISDKTADMLKLKHYIISDTVIAKLTGGKIPERIIEKLERLKNIRYRSSGDFNEALIAEMGKKETESFGPVISELSRSYRIRSRIQVTISDLGGNPVHGIFRVCGVYRTANTGFDQTTAFVNEDELVKLYGGKEILTHEIAILLNNTDESGMVRDKLNRIAGNNSVSTWRELAPDAALLNDFMIVYYFIFIGIIMLALAFGIINTMLMAVLERTRELGMLMAIGMNRRRVFAMIMLETVFLTFTGAIAGMLSGWVITGILGKTGIYLSGWAEGFEALGFASRVYPVVTIDFIMFTSLMVTATAILASVWPARKALKLIPADALSTK